MMVRGGRVGASLGFVALSALLGGCAFGVTVSDEPPELPKAPQRLAIRAILQPGGGFAISRTIKQRMDQTDLFRQVVDITAGAAGASQPQRGDVFVRIVPSAVVDYDSGFPTRAVLTGVANAVFPVLAFVALAPLNIIYSPQFGMEIPFKLTLTTRDGQVVYETDCRQPLDITAQAFASDSEIRDEAYKVAGDAAEQVLLAKLVGDQGLHASIVDAAMGARVDLVEGPRPVPGAIPSPDPDAPHELRPIPTDPGGQSRTFVLIVGINGYADTTIPSLSFAQADAQAIYGFYATDRRSPTDTDRVQVLLGADATRQNVLKAIREHLVQKAIGPHDTALLFFAGHGFADQSETYLATSDTRLDSLPETAISLSTLRSYWGRIQAGRKILITDACHSGGLAGLRGIGGVTTRPGTGGAPGEETFGQSVTIAATGPNQLSLENKALGHGVFTNALLNGLRGDADQDKNGKVSVGELDRYLQDEVRRQAKAAGGDQTPMLAVPGPMRDYELTK